MAPSSNAVPAADPADARAFARHVLEIPATVWLAAESESRQSATGLHSVPRTVSIDDLSLSGLLFVSATDYRRGAFVWIRLRLGAQTYQVKALVGRVSATQVAGQPCCACAVQFVHCDKIAQFIPALAAHLESRSRRVQRGG